ncbi:MAG: NAD+ synthase [Sulfuricella sp.]
MNIALAQCNFTVGDISANAAKLLSFARQAKAAGAEIVVFSELALTGYYPMDLLDEPWFIARQDAALNEVAAASAEIGVTLVFGAATASTKGYGKPHYNSLVVAENGSIAAMYHKQLLPTYNIFDEARHFEPGSEALVWKRSGVRIGFLICEDGWNEDGAQYQANPWEGVRGADLVIAINASPSDIGKPQRREQLFTRLAAKYALPLVYVNQVGANDSIVYDGHSFACNGDGAVRARMAGFTEDLRVVQFDLPSRSFAPALAAPFDDTREAFMFAQLTLGIRDYVAKTGMKTVVVGSSGGIDSALVLALAALALGPENVTAITMPGPYSSPGSVLDSSDLCENFAIELLQWPIGGGFDWAVGAFEDAVGETPSNLTRENLQARLRGLALMAYSNHRGALVLSTGNKSEMSVGYATLYGDMNGGLNPLGDLYKTEVYALAQWINRTFPASPIPAAILEKAPSAELAPGQKDEDSLPPYPVLDEILKYQIEGERLPREEYEQARRFVADLVANGQEALVKRVWQMVAKSEFKRRQAPPIIRVRARAFGSGRQMPVAAKY